MARKETKRKRGRPRLPQGESKVGALPAVRLDTDDLHLVLLAARAANKAVSEWVRDSLRRVAEEQIYQRTLHEAMRIVLNEMPDQAATSSELSEIIGLRGLYQRKDGLAARAQQINARARKYPNLFIVESSGRIRLITPSAADGPV